MSYRILAHLVCDRAHLDELFEAVHVDGERVDLEAWDAFCSRLVRHMELAERVVLPAVRRVAPDETANEARRVKLDHAAVRTLLAKMPTPAILHELRQLLTAGQELEERPGGLFELADRYLVDEASELVALMRAYAPSRPPLARVRPPSDQAVTLTALPRPVRSREGAGR